MDYLQSTDYVLIIVYLLILISLGFYLRKRASKNLGNYFLGGNKLPWWAMGISGMVSFFDVSGTMVIVSFLYLLGPSGIFIEFRGGAVLVLVFWLLWMAYRFGNNWDGNFSRIISAGAWIILNTGMLVYLIKGLGIFLSMFLNFTPVECSLIIIVVATLYTMVSGFYGIVYIDLFQSIFIMIAVITVSILAITSISETDQFALVVEKVTGNSDWFRSLPSIQTEMPKGYKTYEPMAMFAFFYLIRNVITGMATGHDQRYFGARNERECGTLTLLWTNLMMFRWPMMISFAIIGILLVNSFFPDQSILHTATLNIKK